MRSICAIIFISVFVHSRIVIIYRRQSGRDAQVWYLRAYSHHGVFAKDRVDHGQHHSVLNVSMFGTHRLRRTAKWLVPNTYT